MENTVINLSMFCLYMINAYAGLRSFRRAEHRIWIKAVEMTTIMTYF